MSNIEVRDAALYAAVVPTPTLLVRDVALYAAIQPGEQVAVRQTDMAVMRPDTRGFTLRSETVTMMRRDFAHDFSRPVTDLLAAAVVMGLGIAFNGTMGTWHNARENPVAEYFNSLVDLTATPGSALTGTMTLRYNRYDINAAFIGKDPTAFRIMADSTIHALLPQINSQYNLTLTTEDVRDGVVYEGKGLILDVLQGSLRFLFQSTIYLGPPFQAPELGGSIAVGNLTGFDAA